MADSEKISTGFLVDMLNERGYDVVKRGEPDLSDKVSEIGAKLDQMRETPATPADHERRMAEGMLKALNRSLTPWHEPGGSDAA
jgi:hypothetical protein